MARCLACGFENIDGVEHCEDCHGSMEDVGLPDSSGPGLGQRLVEESILELKPQEVVSSYPEATVAEVVRLMCDEQTSGVMILFRGELVGIFTERDFLTKVAHQYHEVAEQPISNFMTAGPEYLESKDSIAFGLNRMAVKHYRHIPVQEEGRPIALVRTKDVIGYITTALKLSNPA